MDGSGGMRPTRFAGGKDRGFVAEPDEVPCDLSSHVLIGNAEVRAHAGFRSTGPAGDKRHCRAGHTAQKRRRSTDIRFMQPPFHGMKLRYSPDQTDPYRKNPPLPLAPIPFHRNAL